MNTSWLFLLVITSTIVTYGDAQCECANFNDYCYLIFSGQECCDCETQVTGVCYGGFCEPDLSAANVCRSFGGDPVTVANGACDPANNIENCFWDGGDCCECDCPPEAAPDIDPCGTGDQPPCLECGSNGFQCLDPSSSCSDVSVTETETETTCSDGTTVGIDGNGVVCCPLGCGQCGGPGCSSAGEEEGLGASDCCGEPIKSSGVYCADTNTAPCIIGSAPEYGTCSDGTVGIDGNGVVCCSLGCGQCGGEGCHSAGLGASHCCGSAIKSSGVYCDDTNTAPCIIGSAPGETDTETCSDGTPGVDGKGVVCCAIGCTQCGGSGCSQAGSEAGLGEADCCEGAIKDSGEYCEDTGAAPCIIGTAP